MMILSITMICLLVINIRNDIIEFDIINKECYNLTRLMAHYSSQLIRYEDGDKRPLKSISMKPLVFALDAQSRVDAGDENSG